EGRNGEKKTVKQEWQKRRKADIRKKRRKVIIKKEAGKELVLRKRKREIECAKFLFFIFYGYSY
ncbi:hypothetical protein LGW71_08935, partial [Streptococcus mutans]|nr:hypothetical protein [Streptococcus mutans]